MVAVFTYALTTRSKVARHAAGRHLRAAAEALGEHLQGYDRDLRFGGRLLDLRAGAALRMAVQGATVRHYDRGSSDHSTGERLVQLYDHAEAVCFSCDVQDA